MHATNRPVLLVGQYSRRDFDSLVRALEGLTPHIEPLRDSTEVGSFLQKGEPRAVLVRADGDDGRETCFRLRANPRFSLVPIILLTDELTDLVFAETYSWGGDDATLISSPESVVRRLRFLPQDQPLDAPTVRGTVLLADRDTNRRILRARVLRNAGFDVRFAVEVGELAQAATRADLLLVLADLDLDPEGVIEALKGARQEQNLTPWLLTTPPKHLAQVALQVQNLAPVAVYDAFAPIENVLFVANELLRGDSQESRSTTRLLYGTTVAFRIAGRDRDEFGFSYNISAEGLYVRTMAPLNSGESVWLELLPPRSDRRVRLETQVVWRRIHGPVHGATAPAGFGLRIIDGCKSDIKRYRDGYQAFAKDLTGAHFSQLPLANPGSPSIPQLTGK